MRVRDLLRGALVLRAMTTATARTRTITWEDPRPALERALTMSGLEYLRAMASGELPKAPIGELMDMLDLQADHGRVVFRGRPGEQHYNPIGVVHGGFAATLLDSAMGCAIQSTLPAGVGYTTLELKVKFVRPLTASTGVVSSIRTVVHPGARVATAEGASRTRPGSCTRAAPRRA